MKGACDSVSHLTGNIPLSGKATSLARWFALLSVWHDGMRLFVFGLCESVEDAWKSVSWAQTTEGDVLFLLVYVMMQGRLCWKKLNRMTSLCLSRLSVLRQRQTPLLQWLWRSAAVLWHQPTRHRRQRCEEGIHMIKPNMLDGWRWQPPWSTTIFTLNVL